MTAGQSPQHPRRKVLAMALAAAASLASLGAVSGCASESKSFAPPRGSITDDRAIGDILVKFTPPEVMATIEGPVRYVVKRPMSGGVWLVTAITAAPDITLEQAVTTLQAAPRVESATSDRTLKPHRTMPTSRDMPAQ
jgi:hypothetical protein